MQLSCKLEDKPPDQYKPVGNAEGIFFKFPPCASFKKIECVFNLQFTFQIYFIIRAVSL